MWKIPCAVAPSMAVQRGCRIKHAKYFKNVQLPVSSPHLFSCGAENLLHKRKKNNNNLNNISPSLTAKTVLLFEFCAKRSCFLGGNNSLFCVSSSGVNTTP